MRISLRGVVNPMSSSAHETRSYSLGSCSSSSSPVPAFRALLEHLNRHWVSSPLPRLPWLEVMLCLIFQDEDIEMVQIFDIAFTPGSQRECTDHGHRVCSTPLFSWTVLGQIPVVFLGKFDTNAEDLRSADVVGKKRSRVNFGRVSHAFGFSHKPLRHTLQGRMEGFLAVATKD